jgi:hypothetical protein
LLSLGTSDSPLAKKGTQVVIVIDSAFIVEAVWAEYIRVGKDTPRQISAVYGRFPQFGDLLQFTADGGIAGQYRDSEP